MSAQDVLTEEERAAIEVEVTEGPLDQPETEYLAELEETIERGLETFIEVGKALMEIRDERLYRETHDTFEDYCADRWSFTGRRARQLMRAAKIGTTVPVANEAQARELDRFAPDAAMVRAIWKKAEEMAEGRGKRVTAEVIREAAKTRERQAKAAGGFTLRLSKKGTYRGGGPPVRVTPATIAASEAAAAASAAIREAAGLLGPRLGFL